MRLDLARLAIVQSIQFSSIANIGIVGIAQIFVFLSDRIRWPSFL